MKTITIDEQAFFVLLDVVEEYLEKKFHMAHDQWITDKEAMSILNIRSKTTLQKFRDNGLIRFSQLEKKIILYDRNSILDYIERNTQETYNRQRQQ